MNILKIPRAPDILVYQAFQELSAKYGISHVSVTAIGSNSLGEIALSVEPSGAWKLLLEQNSFIIQNLVLKVKNYSIRYSRGGTSSSPIYDEILFEERDSNQNTDKATEIDKIVITSFFTKKFNPFDPDRTILNGNLTEEQGHLLAIHSSTLERLQELNEELIRKGIEFRSSLELEFLQKTKEKEIQLNAAGKKMEDEFSQKNISLENKEKALGERLKAIDDRDNTHARREIRDKMLDDVKERISKFGVSTSTESKRKPVMSGIMILFIVLLSLLAWTGNEIYLESKAVTFLNSASLSNADIKNSSQLKDQTAKRDGYSSENVQLYLLWIRFTFLSIGAVGTLLYYIKWQNKWAEQHIAAEFQLQQFYIDVNRANWIIESCLEWRKETESAIPTELLKSITNGLFLHAQDNSEQVMHPADELASALLGSASKLKLKIGENELDFENPKKITNKIIKSEDKK